MPHRRPSLAPYSLLLLAAAGCTVSSSVSGVDLGGSFVVAQPPNVPANGEARASLTVHVSSAAGAPLVGAQVALMAPGCTASVNGPTDAQGNVTGAVLCALAAQHQVTAAVVDEEFQVAVGSPVNVEFYAPSDGRTALLPGTVLIAQAAGSSTVGFVSSDPQATLPAPYTFVPADHGVRQWPTGLVLRTPGTQTVSVVEAASGRVLSTDTYTVSAGTQLTLQAAAQVSAGAPLTVSLQVTVLGGGDAVNYGETLSYTSSDAAATLPGPHQTTPRGSSRDVVTVRFATAGRQQLSVVDSAGNVSRPLVVDVLPGPAVRLTPMAPPAVVAAGSPFVLQAQARDAFGNPVLAYTGSVALTSGDPQASLPAAAAAAPDAQGVFALPPVTLRTAGFIGVQLADALSPALRGQVQLIVTPGPVAALQLGAPTTAQAGTAFAVTLTARDAYGNVATGYRGAVTLTGTDPNGVYPGTYAFAAADLGTVYLDASVALVAAGSASLSIADLQMPALQASAAVAVAPGPLAQLAVAAPSSLTAGTQGDLTVSATDAYGNVLAAYTGAITLSSTDAQAQLPPPFSLGAGDGGSRRFPGGLSLRTSGAQSVGAADANGVAGTALVTVAPGPATGLSLQGVPAGANVAEQLSPTVALVDAYGNAVGNVASTLHFSATDPNAVLPADYALAAKDNGSHSFAAALALGTAGPQTVTVTESSQQLTASAQIAISHGCRTYSFRPPRSGCCSNYGLTVDAQGRPTVATMIFSNVSALNVAQYDGAAWHFLGGQPATVEGGSQSSSAIHDPRVAVAPNQTLGATWTGAPNGLQYQFWDGAQWRGLGGSGSGLGSFGSIDGGDAYKAIGGDLAFDAASRPWLANIIYVNNGTDVQVIRYDGAQWAGVGGQSALGRANNNITPRLASDGNGTMYLTWTGDSSGNADVYVLASDGNTWRDVGNANALGGISQNISASQAPVIAVGPNGRPIVAWQDDASGTYQIFVRAFDGTSWVALGGSASGVGISAGANDSTKPSIAVDAANRPIVVWMDDAQNNGRVYMRRWDGSAWVGTYGSEVGSGIADTGVGYGDTMTPSLTLDPQGNPVILYDGGGEVGVCNWR